MNNLTKPSFRFTRFALSNSTTFKNVLAKRDFTRTLWHMSKNPESSGKATVLKVHNPSMSCNCGCGMKHVHTKGEFEALKGERELVEFLTEEIVAERKALKNKILPETLEGFKINVLGAEVELTKQDEKEKVVINFNVNHSVDADEEPDVDQAAQKPNISEMRSKPQFEVDIIKGKTTLSFTCSFLQGEAQEGEYNDIFAIDEMCIFDNEWNEKVYAVAGDVLDGYLYDLLMNLLEEKGISNEFAEKLSDMATTHEQTSYINLLEKLSKFTISA